MNTWIIWTLALIALGIFIYFVPYRNIKIVQNKLDKVIELLEKNNDFESDGIEKLNRSFFSSYLNLSEISLDYLLYQLRQSILRNQIFY